MLSDSIESMVNDLAHMIDDVSCVLTQMAQGDLAALSQTANYPGDFEQLKTQIEIIHQQFPTTIGSIVHAAQQVAMVLTRWLLPVVSWQAVRHSRQRRFAY